MLRQRRGTRGKSWQFIVKWVLRVLAILFTAASIIVLILQFQEMSDLASLNDVLVGLAAAAGGLLSWLLFKKEPKSERPTIDREEYLRRLHHRCDVPYVSLSTEEIQTRIKSQFEAYDEWLGKNPEAVIEAEPIESIERALEKYDKFVLIGDPGAGKTTTLRYVALRLIADYRAVKGDGKIGPMPLWVNLGDSGNSPDAGELIRHAWQETERIEGDPELDLRDGLVWLLLDGLNEMPDDLVGTGTIENRAKSLRGFLDGYKGPAIITCRVADYDDRLDLGLPVVQVLRLSDEEIKDFAGQLDARQDEFLDALADKPERQALATNPYALTMLIDIFKDPKYALPDNREGLYNAYVQMRYDRYPKDVLGRARVRGDLERLKKGWGKLAYRMMLDARGTRVDEQWARRIVGKRQLQAGINLGLINPVEAKVGMVSFYHDSLYEHFALSRLDLRDGNVWQRVRLVESIGSMGKAALPILPDLTELFLAEADQESFRLYNAARRTLVVIGIDIASEQALWFTLLLCLETFLRTVALARAQASDRARTLDVALDPDLNLTRIFARHFAFDSDLVLDLTNYLAQARAFTLTLTVSLARSIAQSLDISELQRDKIHEELRALAAELAVQSAGVGDSAGGSGED